MKKYYLIYYTCSWNDQKPIHATDVIDISPMEWLIKNHHGKSDGCGPEMYYTQHIIYSLEITETEFAQFTAKYKS